jgi:hypothetical protein
VTTPAPDDARPVDPVEPAPAPAPDPVTTTDPGPAAARARSVRTARLRAERLRLAAVGGVLAVLGVLGLLLGTGLLGDGGAVADPDLVSGAGRNPVLSAAVAALVGVVLAALGGLWLVRSLRRTPAPDLALAGAEGWGEGTILVRGAALAEAARTDAEQVPGVAQARARPGPRPRAAPGGRPRHGLARGGAAGPPAGAHHGGARRAPRGRARGAAGSPRCRRHDGPRLLTVP